MDRTAFRVNWDLCILCRGENKNDKLVSSVNCTRRDTNNLPKFTYVGQLPIQVPLYLDEGKGIKEMLRPHKASWHKSSFHLAQMQQCKADQCSKEEAYRGQSVL
ncbi:unnamed protein product [Porites evermanni]|uniref:Uncharacterized protein n=1 Tax=Porites evermanni TaxID=104178 RepID=A0ABN8N421_9CNID|nr:unnamed protein product [Porites evermanni]